MAIDPTCPNCGSKTTQSVPMVIQQGTSTRNTVGLAGAGIGRRKGAGAWGSTSTTKSGLAQRYQIPPKPSHTGRILLIVLGAFLSFSLLGGCAILLVPGDKAIAALPIGLGVFGALLIFLGLRMKDSTQAKIDAWHDLIQRMEASWLCKKCGHEWIPQEQ